MATRHSSRGTRRSGRLSGGNRPRTHPTPKPRRKPAPKLVEVKSGRRRKWHPGPRATATQRKSVGDIGAAPTHSLREKRKKVPESLPIPIAVELAIQQERATLITSITLLFSLHCILRRQLEGLGEVNEPVESAAKWVNVTELTTMLLGKLHTVLRNLDEIALGEPPDVDPEDVEMTEAVRSLSDEQGGEE
jgi:phage FluMu protein gp41